MRKIIYGRGREAGRASKGGGYQSGRDTGKYAEFQKRTSRKIRGVEAW